MARYKITLAYDGTDFEGFQRQGKARTVQAVFETALHQLSWQGSSILASGRTDSGVHAEAQVVAFDLDWRHETAALERALNAKLPSDVAVRAVEVAPDDFHPRYSARARTYRYVLFCLEGRDPLRERFAWRVWPPVDPDRMISAAAQLVRTADFSAFGNPPKPGGHTIRSVYQTEWVPLPGGWQFEITGNAFLYHMVRRIVYLLVQIGQDRLNEVDLVAAMEITHPLPPGLALPNGLFLFKVWYEDWQT